MSESARSTVADGFRRAYMQTYAKMRGPMRRWILVYSALACGCVALLLLMIWALGGLDQLAALSHDGAIALLLAVVFTVVLSIGLMGLCFYSARKGHDDQVMDGHTSRHNENRWR